VGPSDRAGTVFEVLQAKFGSRQFTSTQAQNALPKLARRTFYRVLDELTGLHVIRQTAKKSGSTPAEYTLTGATPDDSVLPSVESICVPRARRSKYRLAHKTAANKASEPSCASVPQKTGGEP